MKPKNVIKITLMLVLAFVLGACSVLLEDGTKNSGGIQASGVVEAVEVVIASELGGRVDEVFITKGERVSPGDPLFQIEDVLLQAQFQQAKSAYSVAQANYYLIAAGQTNEQKNASISSAKLELASAQYQLKKLYEDTDLLAAQAQTTAETLENQLEDLLNFDLQQAEAMKAIADAQKAVENADRRFRTVSSSASQADIDAAQAQVVLAKDALDDAKKDFEPYAGKPESNLERANFQAKLAAAQQVYDAAVRNLNALKGTGSEADIAVAKADLMTAQAQLLQAQRDWDRIKDGPKESEIALLNAQITKAKKDYETYKNGPDPDDVTLAEARVNNAEAQLALAQADFPTDEELAVAQAQVDSAKANLDAIQTQIDLLIVKTPIGGVVMTRNLEPGEVIQPGLPAMTIGQIDKLTVTVYIPEDKYGQINLGDQASLTFDSFPGEVFEASVTRIADQAEYTPRNVQTKEDRQTTVYAIELSVSDPQGKLKPGMPTDVTFDK